MEPTEVKQVVDKLGSAFEEFKAANDARLKEIEKKGAADYVTTDKVDRINEALSDLQEFKKKVETAHQRSDKDDREEKADKNGAEYKKAFIDYARKGIEAPELKALSVGSDPDGGYLVTPETSSRIIKIVYETTAMRQLASVQTISSDALEMLEDRGEITSGWVSEVGTRSETNTPTFGKKNIPVHELYAKPKATQKLLDDAAVNIEDWLAGKVAEHFARKENTAFVSGDGVGKPRGILTYSAGSTWGTIEQVASGSSATLGSTADKLIDLLYALKPPYSRNATWLMNRSTILLARKLKAHDNQYIWQPGIQAGQPDSLLGRPVSEGTDMPVPAADSLSVAVGDFREAYQIVDRIGIRTLRDPYSEKPFIQFYTTKRVGGDVVNFEAIKIMKLGS